MAINLRTENHWFSSGKNLNDGRVVYLMEDGSLAELNYKTDSMKWHKLSMYAKDNIVAKFTPVGYARSDNKKWSAEYYGPRGGMVYEYYNDLNDETIQQMLARKVLRETIESDLQKDPIAHLSRTMKEHDWYYFYSDDYSVYSGGSAHADKMSKLISEVEPKVAYEMWMTYCPWAKEDGLSFEQFKKNNYPGM